MTDHTAAAVLERIEHLAAIGRPADTRWLNLCRQVDPQRVIRNLTAEHVEGADREASEELARRAPRDEANSVAIPWESLYLRTRRYAQRADVAGTSSAGGYLVETLNTQSAAQSLLAMLILGRLGCSAISSTANLNMPRVTASASTTWMSTETTTVSESDQTFGQISLTPHQVGGYSEMSRLLVLQSSPDAADVVSSDLMRKVSRTIEAAAFAGAGSAGQPHGVIGLSGTNAVSGGTFALSTAASAVGDVGDALDMDTAPGFAVARSVAILLRQRQEFTNGTRTIWEGPATIGTLASYNAAASSGVPSATGIFGCWRFLVLCDFGGGLTVSVNPYANFPQGVIGLRAFAVVDCGAVWPGAFSIISSIT